MESMSTYIIIILVVGIIFIIFSFIKSSNGETEENSTSNIPPESNPPLRDEYETISKEVNSKILELNDYADFVQKQIDDKHKELLFLYQLIDEKEKSVVKEQPENHYAEITDKDKINRHFDSKIEETNKTNNNDKIINLYQQGYDITTIAKELCIGKGEVKLVIDLFK